MPERLLHTLVDFSGTGCSYNCAGCMSHKHLCAYAPMLACSGAAGGRAQGDTQDERGGAGSVLRDAVQTMMTNTRGPRSSEFYRLASE